ncbi:hypothetical protein B0H15DRAFT_802375 [Mycena belliarum]|uniref:Uncharacterized protein n=1 Tax=Mycena belliarum TaxID=1033014 RepID=A0AAD6XSR2_9AGAR|nr:hypothetical protein B0H15DRAFT_802375 [Mycena belliae]
MFEVCRGAPASHLARVLLLFGTTTGRGKLSKGAGIVKDSFSLEQKLQKLGILWREAARTVTVAVANIAARGSATGISAPNSSLGELPSRSEGGVSSSGCDLLLLTPGRVYCFPAPRAASPRLGLVLKLLGPATRTCVDNFGGIPGIPAILRSA